jgi:hypothetical protein
LVSDYYAADKTEVRNAFNDAFSVESLTLVKVNIVARNFVVVVVVLARRDRDGATSRSSGKRLPIEVRPVAKRRRTTTLGGEERPITGGEGGDLGRRIVRDGQPRDVGHAIEDQRFGKRHANEVSGHLQRAQ